MSHSHPPLHVPTGRGQTMQTTFCPENWNRCGHPEAPIGTFTEPLPPPPSQAKEGERNEHEMEPRAMKTAVAGAVGADGGEANLTHCPPPPPPTSPSPAWKHRPWVHTTGLLCVCIDVSPPPVPKHRLAQAPPPDMAQDMTRQDTVCVLRVNRVWHREYRCTYA